MEPLDEKLQRLILALPNMTASEKLSVTRALLEGPRELVRKIEEASKSPGEGGITAIEQMLASARERVKVVEGIVRQLEALVTFEEEAVEQFAKYAPPPLKNN